MKICVLQPDYTGSTVDYANYDPPRNLTPWLSGHQVDHLFLRKATSYRQLMKAAELGYDIFINLCEGYPEWDIAGFDVIWALERLNLPFTGTTMRNFLHSKETMKIVALACGVATPAWWVMRKMDDLADMPTALHYPLFVKPADAGDSLGIDEQSLVLSEEELRVRCAALLPDFHKLLIEEYVDGREFTVLAAGDPESPDGVLALTPFEFIFQRSDRFKTYRMKVTEHHKANNVPVMETGLAEGLKQMAVKIFRGFEAESYARIDMRGNAAGELFFLEINCECSIFYPAGSEGSADYVLQHEAMGHAGFLQHVIGEGIRRHRLAQKPYEARLSANGSVGCFATRDLDKGEVLRLRPERAGAWAPFRKSAKGNVVWRGPDVVAQRPIHKGEELLFGG